MSLYGIVKSLQSTQGNNAKLAILEENKGNDLLKAYMKAVFDPAINYYQTKLPKIDKGFKGDREFELIDILFMVDRLAGRQLTGNDAKAALAGHVSVLNPEGRELVQHIIARKIDKSNVGETMVLKTWPELFFIPGYMRCASMDAKVVEHYRKQESFLVQPKRDGSFAYAVKNGGEFMLCSRTGSIYPQWFANHICNGMTGNTVLAGELEVYQITATNHDGNVLELLDRKTGNGILSSIEKGADPIEFIDYEFTFVAWDCFRVSEWKAEKSEIPYKDRLEEMWNQVFDMRQAESIESHKVTSVEAAFAINTDLTTQGKEGTVWKTLTGGWRNSSSGTKDMVKLKVKFRADYEIEGYYEGEGKAAGMLGGLSVKTKCDKLRTNVGSGFTDKERIELWESREELPGKIVELEANDVITNRERPEVLALSLPIYIEIRSDKKEADTLERVIQQRDAAREGK